MTLSVKEIERAIESLPQEDWDELNLWMADYKFRKWDEQIADDPSLVLDWAVRRVRL